METMHHDMGGAAATLAAMDAVGRLGIKVNVGEATAAAAAESFSELQHSKES